MKSQNSLLEKQLVERLKQALTASSESLYQHILDPQPEVIIAALKNRQLQPDHLLALLKRRNLNEEIIDKIHRRAGEPLNHKLILALVKNPSSPGRIIRTLLPQLHLFELVDICSLAGATVDQKLAAERVILQRLPTIPLGNKLTLARRATANIVAELIKDGNPALTEVCLNNPHLKEASIFQLLNGPHASAETISIIGRHSRWQQRANLRMAILKNNRTPDIWFSLWLPKIPLPQIKQLHLNHKLNPRIKGFIANESRRRGLI